MIDEQSWRLNRETDALTNQAAELLPMAAAGFEGVEELRRKWAAMPMAPRVRPKRTDGWDVSWPGFDVRTLLVGEESAGRFTIHDVIVAPGAELPSFHLEVDTYLCVLEGDLRLTVGDLVETARKDAFAFIPEGAAQALKNESGGPARLLLWHSPAGAERAFAAAHALWLAQPGAPASAYLDVLSGFGFRFHKDGAAARPHGQVNAPAAFLEAEVNSLDDFMALRRKWEDLPPVPKLLHDWRTAKCVDVPGQDTRVLLSGEEARGRCVVFQYGLDPGYRAPVHHQPTEEEIFLVVEGVLTLTAGNQTTELGVGGMGFVPRYGTHNFTNAMERGQVRTVTINSPAGHERAFAAAMVELGRPEGPSDKLPGVLEAHGWHFHEHVDVDALK